MSLVFAKVKLQCVQSIPQGYIAKMSLCLFPMEQQQNVFAKKYLLSVFTYANRFRLVPARLAISPHDASECGVSLQRIAIVTVIGDSCTQFQLCTNTSTVPHQAWFKA